MKTRTITTILIACFALTSFSQSTTKEKQKPKETYQVGSAKVVVWENKRNDGSTWKNYKIEKQYQTKDGEWKATSSFNANELLELKEVIDKAITEEKISSKEENQKKSEITGDYELQADSALIYYYHDDGKSLDSCYMYFFHDFSTDDHIDYIDDIDI